MQVGNSIRIAGVRVLRFLSVIGCIHEADRFRPIFEHYKRGIYGTFHQVSTKHLGRYCNEFSYRFNRRDEQLQMFDGKLKSILDEKAWPCKKLTASVQKW